MNAGNSQPTLAPGTVSDPSARQNPIILCAIILLLTAVSVLNNMDRVLFAVLAEPIKKEFSLSDTQFGSLAGIVFSSFYTIGAIPLARMADLYGRSYILGACVALWSMATAATGAAGSFLHLILARAALGFGEAGCVPPSQALIAAKVPPAWRGRAMGIVGAGAGIGGVLGLMIGGSLAAVVGWRITFYMAGAAGLVVALLVAVTLREGRSTSVARSPAEPILVIAKTHITDPVFALRCAAAVGAVVAVTGQASWLPAYAMRAYGLPISTVGHWLGVAAIFYIFGMFGGGFLISRNTPGGHITMPVPALFCVFGGALCAYGFMSDSFFKMMIFVTVGHILYLTYYAPIFTAVVDSAPPKSRAQLPAVVFVLTSSLGAGGGPTLVGIVSDMTAPTLGVHSLGVGLAISGSFVSLSGICMLAADAIVRQRARRLV